MFSAFDWGFQKKVPERKASQETAYADKKEVSPKRTDQTATSAGTIAKGPINPEALATVTRVLGSGTPEERQGRMESLKRLSEALRKKQS